jgi:tetratricopeptide (TPR) repeat protein
MRTLTATENTISRQYLCLISSRVVLYVSHLCSKLNVVFCPIATGTPTSTLEQPWQVSPDSLPLYRVDIRKEFLSSKEYEDALNMYEQALITMPRNPELHLRKGEALLGLGHYKDALAAYEEAIRLAPDLSAAYRGQGKAYDRLADQVLVELKQQAQVHYAIAEKLGVTGFRQAAGE